MCASISFVLYHSVGWAIVDMAKQVLVLMLLFNWTFYMLT